MYLRIINSDFKRNNISMFSIYNFVDEMVVIKETILIPDGNTFKYIQRVCAHLVFQFTLFQVTDCLMLYV